MSEKNIQLADSFAKDYDEQVAKNNWIGPEVLFKLCEEYIQPAQKLLDLGIGTGVSALPFKNAGLKITGVDASKEMLKVCRRKNIAEKLILCNLENRPLSFKDSAFDVVISNALFHLIDPIQPLFQEAARILSPGGIFALTYEDAAEIQGYNNKYKGVWETKTSSEVTTYKHENEYIESILIKAGFKITAKKQFLAFQNKELNKDFYFTAIAAIKTIDPD